MMRYRIDFKSWRIICGTDSEVRESEYVDVQATNGCEAGGIYPLLEAAAGGGPKY